MVGEQAARWAVRDGAPHDRPGRRGPFSGHGRSGRGMVY